MTHWRGSIFLSLALTASCGGATSSDTAATDVNLTLASDGQAVSARVGQGIALRLSSIGPGQYGDPEISSPSVKFVDMTFPRLQNPGGPTQDYRFVASGIGSTVIRIAHTEQPRTFTVTVNVSD